MSSCVSSGEQNELVVRTGIELRLRRLDVEMLRGKNVFFCKDRKDSKYSPEILEIYAKMHNTGTKEMCRIWYTFNEKALDNVGTRLFQISSILDIPKEYRSNAVVICFGEPSYSGRQSLYHTLGGKHFQTYDSFVKVMEEVQKNGDALVLGLDETMWFPGPKSEIHMPLLDVMMLKGEVVSVLAPKELLGVIDAAKDYISKSTGNDPVYSATRFSFFSDELQTTSIFICFGETSDSGKRSIYEKFKSRYFQTYEDFIYALESVQKTGDALVLGMQMLMRFSLPKHQEAAAFQESIKAIKPSLKIQEEPDLKTQVTTLTDAIKTLTEVVAKLAAKV